MTSKKKETPMDEDPAEGKSRADEINEILGKYIPTGKMLSFSAKNGKGDDKKARFLANMKKGREAAKAGHAKPVQGVTKAKVPAKATPAA